MKLHFLRYFSVLSEELHFGRAADRLAITQPPLSAAIKALEEELGVVLLLRNSKMVKLTPEGVAFALEARQILERVERAKSVVAGIKGGVIGRLDIGLSPSLIYRNVIQIIDGFKAEVRGIEIVLHEMPYGEQVQRLMRGQIQVGFTNGAYAPSPLKSLRLKDDQFVLCLPERHPKAMQQTIDLREMGDEEFIIFSREIGPSNHDNLISIFSQVGVHPRTVHQVRGWFTTMALVSQGCGVALVPSTLVGAKIEGVRFVPIGRPKAIAPAMMVWNATPPVPATESFVDIASRTIQHKGW